MACPPAAKADDATIVISPKANPPLSGSVRAPFERNMPPAPSPFVNETLRANGRQIQVADWSNGYRSAQARLFCNNAQWWDQGLAECTIRGFGRLAVRP